MKSNIQWSLLVMLLCWFTPSQAQNYEILFKTGTHTFPERLELDAAKKTTINGSFYAFVQFYDLPSPTQHADLEALEIELLSYIPNYTYIAAIPNNLTEADLREQNIRALAAISPDFKLNENLLGQDFPDYASHRSQVKVMLKYYKNIPHAQVLAWCMRAGIQVQKENGLNNYLAVTIDKNKMEAIAALPFVAYLELAPAPGTPDDTNGRGLHRANTIDSDFGAGRHLTGEGVSVLVRDDGIVGASQEVPHIDFWGRMTQYAEANGGIEHADGVAGIFAGSGNINPRMRGMAAGADVYVIDYTAEFLDNTLPLHLNEGVLVTNSSYSNGCNAGYTAITATVDQQMFENPTLMHVFSAGNSNGGDCGYGAGDQWGNITGGHKQGKNVIATANLRPDGTLETSSSRGPAYDGRIKPDISANGTDQFSLAPDNTYEAFGGTSAASPGIAGIVAQLHQAYRELNNGEIAPAALLKATLLNTANDRGNIGPDFLYGWGQVNALHAVRALEDERYMTATIGHNMTNTHTISVPENVQEVRVMTYWAEPESGESTELPALLSNINTQVILADGSAQLPLVLDHTADPVALNTPAAPGIDNLNNMEQVRLYDLAAGDYELEVTGATITVAEQAYWVVYEFIYNDEIELIYPYGGEAFVPNEVERIHWDAWGNGGNFLLEYSNDGTVYEELTSISGGLRMYDWTVPNDISGQVFLRISRNGVGDTNNAPCKIITIPQLNVTQVCPDYIRLEWNNIADAAAYDLFRLGEQYMDSVTTVTGLTYDMPITSPQALDNWFAIRSVHADGWSSRRAIAINYNGDLQACPQDNNMKLSAINSPSNGLIAICDSEEFAVSIDLENEGLLEQTDIMVGYQIDNNPPVIESLGSSLAANASDSYTFSQTVTITETVDAELKTWVSVPNETATYNDTLSQNITIILYDGDGVATIQEDFQSADFPNSEAFIINSDAGITWDTTTVTGIIDTPTTALYINNYSYPDTGEEDEFRLPLLDLTTATSGNSALTFDVAYAYFDDGFWDALRVDVSDDCGETWETIYYKEKEELATGGQQGPLWFPESSSDWRTDAVSLSNYEGSSIIIRFVNIAGYGNSLLVDNINLVEIVAPTAAFELSNSEVCVGEIVTFTNNSTGSIDSYLWNFGPNAVPSTATGVGPHNVIYNTMGDKEVNLTVSGNGISNTTSQTIMAQDVPVADFDIASNVEGIIQVNNLSQNGTTYEWNFGETNEVSSDENPSYAYSATGDYTVTLSATNACGTETFSIVVTVMVTSLNDLGNQVLASIQPNPNTGTFNVTLSGLTADKLTLNVLNIHGQLLHNEQLNNITNTVQHRIAVDELPTGIYWLQLQTETGQRVLKMVVE